MDPVTRQYTVGIKKFRVSISCRKKSNSLGGHLGLLMSILFLAACSGQPFYKSNRPVVVQAYNYHQYPPYLIENKVQSGLGHDWVSYINRYLTTIRLEHIDIKRPALNKLLENKAPGIVLWGNPQWFGAYPFLTASVPILLDGDMLVSSSARPVVELSPGAGHRLCAIKSYVYPTTEPWIVNGALQRIDRESTTQCLTAIKENQADVALINRSQWLYLSGDERQRHWYMMPEPIDAFARHLLVSPHYASLLPELNAAIVAVNHDKDWQRLMLDYGSNDFLNLFDLKLEQLQTLPLPK